MWMTDFKLYDLSGGKPQENGGSAGKPVTIPDPVDDIVRREIIGTDGNETIRGTNASEIIEGRGGDDNIAGGGGDDILIGGSGTDRLYGGSGNDILWGGPGLDRLAGESGADTFVFDHSAIADGKAKASDILLDYRASEGDLIDISRLLPSSVNGANLDDYVRHKNNALMVDLDGSGKLHGFVTIARFGSNSDQSLVKILLDDATVAALS
jgi:Ca2+-binding RTX toxin-like protein